MRFVLDPGVLIAAVVAPRGVCGQLLRRWLDGECELVVSPALLDELEEVLLRRRFRRYLSEEEVRQFVHLVAATAELIADPASHPGLTRDPDDDYLVALACATSVDALVSGDADLTSLPDPVPPILSPRATLDHLNRAREARASGEGELRDESSSAAWTQRLDMEPLPNESAWVSVAVRASREPARREGSIDGCAACGLLLPLDHSAAVEGRLPCPRCGSLTRAYARSLVDRV
jgi:putative PIN family toxin of toxin-antitoxin system